MPAPSGSRASPMTRDSVVTAMPSSTGVAHEATNPRRPFTSTRHNRQDPNALSEPVAQSLGI